MQEDRELSFLSWLWQWLNTCSLSFLFCLSSLVLYTTFLTQPWVLSRFTAMGLHALLQHYSAPTATLKSQQKSRFAVYTRIWRQVSQHFTDCWVLLLRLEVEISSRSENSTARKTLFRSTCHSFLCCAASFICVCVQFTHLSTHHCTNNFTSC